MKKTIKKLYFLIQELIFNIFFIKEEFRFMGIKNYLLYFLFQRIFRINSQVPWPVHWTSVVAGHKNIVYKREITPLGYSPGSYIQATNGIVIGSNVIHAVGVTIITANHEINNFTKHTENKPVVIGNNCWLGANITILPEVELGDHTIVAAGSVITKSFLEGNCIIGGIPAKIIKKIDNYNGEHYFLKNKFVKDNSIIDKVN